MQRQSSPRYIYGQSALPFSLACYLFSTQGRHFLWLQTDNLSASSLPTTHFVCNMSNNYTITLEDKNTNNHSDDNRNLQCPSTAAEDLTRWSRPAIFTYADDGSSSVDISDRRLRRLSFNTRSAITANVIVCTVQSAAARSRTYRH